MRTRAAKPDPRPVRVGVVLAGLAIGLAIAGGAELAIFNATATENTGLRAKLARLQTENARTEQMIGAYGEFEAEAKRVDEEFQSAIAAVPTEAELASVLDDLERVTSASGVSLVRFLPGPVARPQPSARGGPNAKAPSAPPVTLQTRPVAATLRCTFADFQRLLARLAEYPRLLTVESFSVRSATAGAYTVEASIGLSCYYKQAPAEARPSAPAPRRGSEAR